MNYSWEPGFEHDWLAVDRYGQLGYFMSAYDSILPDSIMIPWQYLHNLPYMWISHNISVPCLKIKKNLSYQEIVKFLANSGLSVWDASMDNGRLVFLKVASPNQSLRVDAVPAFFRSIANSFYVAHESFESSQILREILFENKENIKCQHYCGSRMNRRAISFDKEILEKVLSACSCKMMISIADRCAIEDAPDVIGPSFSCWNVARCCYVDLVKELTAVLKCDKIWTCDFMGVWRVLNLSDFENILAKMPIPFFSVSIQRRDGGKVIISLPKQNVVGYKSYDVSTGYLSGYEENVHVEDWDFEICVESNMSDRTLHSKVMSMIMRTPLVGAFLNGRDLEKKYLI